MNRHIAPRSIAKTMALTMLCISTLTLIVISSIGMYSNYLSQRQNVASQQMLIAQNASSSVRSFVQDKIRTLNSAVQYNYLSGIPRTDPTSTLERLMSLEPAFNQVALLNAQHKEVGQASRLSDVYDGSITAQIDENQLYRAVSQNKNFISHVYIDEASGDPQVIIAVPINSVYTGFSGTLLAETDLKFMWSLVGNIKVGVNGLAYVVDENGVLIAAGDTSRVLKHENLSNLAVVKQFLSTHASPKNTVINNSRGLNGTDVVSTYAALGTPDWAVVTETPVAEVYAPLERNVLISTMLILIGLALSIIASILLARRITKPITTLRDVVNRFGMGESGIKINIESNNEVGELGKAFNAMAINLQTSAAKLLYERDKLEASINSLDVGLLIISTDDNVMVNPAARVILGYPKEDKAKHFDIEAVVTLERIEKSLGSVIELKADITRVLKTLKPIEQKVIDFNSRVLRIFIAPILNSSVVTDIQPGVVVLMEDITEAKILERSKDEFFSIASHELRTPLTSIKGNSSMILSFYKEVLKDEQLKEMVVDIHTSTVRLIEIVNDFLDMSRLEQGKMSFSYESISVSKVVESVAYEMKAVLDEKNLYFKVDSPALNMLPPVWADENRLKQIIYNLIGNALKFTEKGGITISAKLAEDKKFTKILVVDTGRGMTKESQRLLFHKFQQASSSLLTRDTTRGTGLGLYISKMMVEIMGGNIKLERSEPDKGSVFSFTLPVASAKQKVSTPQPISFTDYNTGLTTTNPAPVGKS